MNKDSKIYIAGHRGLVGSAIWNSLVKKGYTNLIGQSHSELDLTDSLLVRDYFFREKPEYVILAAAYVGGMSRSCCFWAAPAFIQKNHLNQCVKSIF